MASTHALEVDGLIRQLFEADPNLPQPWRVIDVSAYPAVAEGWVVAADGSVIPPPVVAPTAEALRDYAGLVRRATEFGGITVAGVQIATDLESQTRIANAYAFMQASAVASVQFKSLSGWITLTADQVKAIALAVGAHVQACFQAEDTADAAISAGTITTHQQVDAAFATPSA